MEQAMVRPGRRSGWSDAENRMLWETADEAQQQGLPLKAVFERIAEQTGRRPNSIRNYYYAQVRRQGGESHPARFVPFTQPEIDWLMEQVLVARAAGQSVRACLQKLSGGDHSLMLRYQNKYRAVVKSRSEYVRGLVEKLNEQGVECDAPTVSHRERADLGQACARMEEAARRSGDGELARACDTLARYLQSAAPAPDAALRAAEKLVQPIKEFLARPASERADGMDEFCALLAERIGEMEAARTDLQPSRSENLQ